MITTDEILKLTPLFTGEFECEDDVYGNFAVSPTPGVKILFADYDQPDYEGYANVLYFFEGKFYSVHGSHCSCFGLEDQWDPEEISDKELEHYFNNGGPMWDTLKEFISQKK